MDVFDSVGNSCYGLTRIIAFSTIILIIVFCCFVWLFCCSLKKSTRKPTKPFVLILRTRRRRRRRPSPRRNGGTLRNSPTSSARPRSKSTRQPFWPNWDRNRRPKKDDGAVPGIPCPWTLWGRRHSLFLSPYSTSVWLQFVHSIKCEMKHKQRMESIGNVYLSYDLATNFPPFLPSLIDWFCLSESVQLWWKNCF